MSHTKLSIDGENFRINGKLTYEELGGPEHMRGLLMNARFIQGVFDDAADPTRFNRFGRTFDPDKNTDDLIAALPAWYDAGLRAITVGFQGGGPFYTTKNETIDNNPYLENGTKIDPKYQERMARILDAADKLGMVVIVSLLYAGQIKRLGGTQAILNAVRTASAFLREGKWQNIIIEVANEYTLEQFADVPIIQKGIVALIELARNESGGLPVGSSGGGGILEREVAEASDVILVHGNGITRQQFATMINKARKFAPNKPIVCNEDSQALSNMQVCLDMGVSWGYYNNLTKQEPPTEWGITRGEDQFFAWRMANSLGLNPEPIPADEQFVLMGLGAYEHTDGKCWPRLAALYPEQVDYVDFYKDGVHLDRCYDDPFTLNHIFNWLQLPQEYSAGKWEAAATLRDRSTVVRSTECK